jgi:hypothetical protein
MLMSRSYIDSISSCNDETKIVLKNGDIYIGSVTDQNENFIIGHFVKGIIYKKNGNVYEGEFYNGRELIKGKIYEHADISNDSLLNVINVDNSVVYESNNRRFLDGMAKIYNVNGIIYDGFYSYGFFINGIISCIYPICDKKSLCQNNITYNGWHISDVSSLSNCFFGEAIYQNGSICNGIFYFDFIKTNNKINDRILLGKITFKDIIQQITFNKDEYNGDISNFTTDVGKIIFSDGRIYEGEFLNGKLKNGKITYPDYETVHHYGINYHCGDIVEGEFNDNPTNCVHICDFDRIYLYLKKGTVKTEYHTLNGIFENGLLVDGTAEHNNGIKFHGKYVYVCHFEGTLVYPTGETTTGHFDTRALDI